MPSLLKLSNFIDRLNGKIGQLIRWLVLAAVLVSAGNAIVRKAFSLSSNSLLEIQWYLFSAVFLLGSGYTLLRNAHVRIDILSSRLSKRANAWIDAAGIVVIAIPFCVILVFFSWPLLQNAWSSGEMSQNAGGLIRWPVYAMVPAGFSLLLAQAVSELIKRVAFLRGHITEPTGFADMTQESPADEQPASG